jgi:divalent metal cation (Fe/Co/Zn/Cd) transporter
MIILMTIVVFWYMDFNMRLSRFIGSASLKATGVEARNDALTNMALLVVFLLDRFFGVNIDGFVGVAFGVLIAYSGFRMVIETTGPLLGQSPNPETVKEIANLVLAQKGVLGIHDLMVHDYGPGHVFASVHIEVDSREDVFKSHELVDEIERHAQKEMNVFLVGHMDPLDTQNPRIQELTDILKAALPRVEGFIGFHDLRIVIGRHHNNIVFDAVVSHEDPELTFKNIERIAQEALWAVDPSYHVIVNRDLDYSAANQ